jgi:hypothetical protein
MRKHSLVFSLGLFLFLQAPLCAVNSKTFLSPRSISQDAVLQQSMRSYWINHTGYENLFAIDGTVFYKESTNSGDLAQYFFPPRRSLLVIKGTEATGDKDISASWLQISGQGDDGMYLNNFESKIKIRPSRESFGAILNLQAQFYSWWLFASFPFVQVTTNLHLREFDKLNYLENKSEIKNFVVADPADLQVTRFDVPYIDNNISAKGALDNSLWKYGKIKDGNQKLAGLADVTLKGAFRAFNRRDLKFDIYGDLVIPTGYKPKAEYLFEPLIGNGGHWGLGGGLNIDIGLIKKAKHCLDFLTDLNVTYFFENEEKRSFDLTPNGPWSRYLLVINEKDSVLPQPGINFFTKDLKVTPKCQVNWLVALHSHHRVCDIEFGYNFWYREKEKVELNEWNEKIYICHTLYNEPEQTPFRTTSFSEAKISSNINEAGQGDPDLVYVNLENLNMESAACPDAISSKFYLSLQFNGKHVGTPLSANFGAAYEFAQSNKSLEEWSVWAQANLMF